MKLIRQDEAQATPNRTPIMVGDVVSQNLVAEGDAALLRVTAVTFRNGARNRLHHHSTDQVLVVTHGRGIVATEREEFHVSPGDIILIAPEERHWHGAEPGENFTHLSILTPGQATIDEEPATA
jgi:quercetin dioxygenase-like cupin family protein